MDVDQETVTVALTVFYTFLLVAPSTPLAPRAILRLSLLCTVVLPFLFAAVVVACHGESSVSFTPKWFSPLHGPAANHDFCEENYRYTGYLAEFHNSWSSLPIIFYGGLGPYYTRKYATSEARFSASFISIGAVGIGSTLYHGTLMRFGQVLDEVPMLCIIFAGAFCFIEDQKEPKHGQWLPILLIAACMALVAGYLVYYLYVLFLMAFAGGVVLLLVRGLAVQRKASKLSGRLLGIAAMSILCGFVCWMVDEHFCTSVQHLRLHIGWHIATGFGGYMFTMFLVTLRASVVDKVAVLVVSARNFRSGWRLSHDLKWEPCKRPEFLLPYVEWRSPGRQRTD